MSGFSQGSCPNHASETLTPKSGNREKCGHEVLDAVYIKRPFVEETSYIPAVELQSLGNSTYGWICQIVEDGIHDTGKDVRQAHKRNEVADVTVDMTLGNTASMSHQLVSY